MEWKEARELFASRIMQGELASIGDGEDPLCKSPVQLALHLDTPIRVATLRF